MSFLTLAEALATVAINGSNTSDEAPPQRPRDLEPESHVSVAALSQFTKKHYILGRYETIRGMLKKS